MKGIDNMKLSQMGFIPMHCIIYQQDGRIYKEYNEKRMQELIERKADYVIVYNPNAEQKQEILDTMNIDNKQEKVTVSGIKVLGLIERLTNIDVGLESGELTIEEAIEIVNNPNPMLETVSQVVNSILVTILKEQLSVIEEVAQLPEPVKQSLLEETMNKEKREKEAKKANEIAELEAKLKELRGE